MNATGEPTCICKTYDRHEGSVVWHEIEFRLECPFHFPTSKPHKATLVQKGSRTPRSDQNPSTARESTQLPLAPEDGADGSGTLF